jgi:CDP-diacylglycerol--glycerol-3-phosphate 3-phosphatidyltransferase
MANAITLSRLPLLLLVVLLLYLGSPWVQVATTGLVVLLIVLDSIDGLVARRRHEVGMVGSKLDIAVDRIVELVMWVVYAHLGLISVAIPIIVIMRGTLVDAVRSFSLVWGQTSFGMMQTSWGKWLVGSAFMRTGYAVAKGIAFGLLALALGLRNLAQGTRHAGWAEGLWIAAVVVSWMATAICLVRGAPVLWEARTLLRDLDARVGKQANRK